MEIIIKSRGCGKTYQLIKKAAATGDCIVCGNMKEAARIQAVAKDLGLNIPFPITYREFTDGKYNGRSIDGFLIDNVELFLGGLSNVPIKAIALNSLKKTGMIVNIK